MRLRRHLWWRRAATIRTYSSWLVPCLNAPLSKSCASESWAARLGRASVAELESVLRPRRRAGASDDEVSVSSPEDEEPVCCPPLDVDDELRDEVARPPRRLQSVQRPLCWTK